jgi:putative heme-binding domain-containing protein
MPPTLRASLACLVILFAVTPLPAQRDARVPDPDPELERRSFQLADGFEVNLFAADPLLAKPIQMNFDPAGRLWIACSETYPQIKPGQTANDKIVVVEDSTGSGKADKVTVFADGLLIPTGLEPGDGGVYVADSTELLHLADTDGDGKADRRRVVLSGFGTEDTHHMLHTLRWGPDGMLYMNQSIYIHSHIETPHGPRRLGGGGIWQFRPETLQLDVFARGWVNPWGHHFDRWGQSFVTDGAGGEGINYVLPGASYTSAVGAVRLVQGLNPGSPKYCGEEILSGRHLPEEWRGNIITNDFRGHRVCRFVLKEDGAGYVAQEKTELIKTPHEAFRPIDVKMGPDGAIYIADWYNPIIQHGEVDFRDPRRDHVHGRIWRVTAKGRPPVPRPQLVKATNEELLDALKAPEDWTRHHAKRVLKEHGRQVEPALTAWAARLNPADAEHDHHLLEALWTYQSLDLVEPKVLATLLHSKDHHARAAAVRVIQHWHDRLPNALELLAAAVADDHPQVRLEAVRALAAISQPRSVELATQALDKPVDRYVDYALWLTARELEPAWLPALQAGHLDFGGNSGHLLFALQAVGTRDVVKPLVGLIRGGKVPKEREESVLAMIAALGGAQEMGMILDLVLARDVPDAARQANLLVALQQATQQRGVRPDGDLKRIAPLLDADSETVRAAAARAAGLWRIEALRPKLQEAARADKSSEAVRQAAFDGLMRLGGPASKNAFEELADPTQPLRVRRLAVIALAPLDVEGAAKRAVDVLADARDGDDPTDLFNAFVERKNGLAVLTKALADRKLPADVAKLGLRTVRASGRDQPELIAALTKAGGLTGGPRVLNPQEMQQMIADVARQGDAARGEVVFRRKDQICLKCHAIAGAGGQVGPDLASIGGSAPVDYLIDSLLLPNNAVKEGYHSLVVTTTDGRVLTGIKVRETKTELVLRTAEDKEITVLVKDIDDKVNGASLMPDGLTDPLTRAELIDLVRFLSELGKVGPYAVSKARLVRRWQALEPTPAAQGVLQRGPAAAAGNDPALTWQPAYSQVSGVLPLDALSKVEVAGKALGFVRCQLDASTPGKVKVLLNGASGVTAWLDGGAVEVKDEMILDVPPGLHTLTFAVDLGTRRDALRCELDDVAGSPARVRLIGGK